MCIKIKYIAPYSTNNTNNTKGSLCANSQNQLTKLEYQSESDTDYKRYIYFYDYAGRMLSVSTEESGPPPDYNYAYAVYKYNENSQVDSVFMNNFNQTLSYSFNNRNWITNCVNSSSIFGYSLDYALNGNVTNQTISGIYRNNFSNTKDVRSNFTYDKSNRLKKVKRYNTKYFDLTGEYTYDPDGNFTSLTRSYNSDNFTYDYYSGTNRLKKVTGSTDQYTYDYNGNQTNDYFAGNTGISFDHRNLITEITRSDNTTDPPTTIKIRYKYDEAGNRIRKTIYQTQDENPLPITNSDNLTGWTITKDEYYSRDASGKEIAVYQGYNLDYWNVWGTGNEGRIKSTGMKYFYLKDHLGSIRAVINQNNVLVQAQDYDPWGHIARTWDSTSNDYKFTGKEHDKESSYDYFGARYYDARVGRWGGVEPLLEKYFSYSSYQYGLLNPIKLVDADGRIIVLPDSKEARQNCVNILAKGLPKEIREYLKVTEYNGNFIIDPKSLSVATELSNSRILRNLTKVAKSEKIVEFSILTDNLEFNYKDENGAKGKDKLGKWGDGSTRVGNTLFPIETKGVIQYSTNENTQIYMDGTTDEEVLIGKSYHEILGHFGSWINKERYTHEYWGDYFDFKMYQIEEEAKENSKE